MHLKQTLSELRILGRKLMRELGVVDSATNRDEISLSQCHILVEIEQDGMLTAKELTRRLLVDKAAISRAVAQLCESGYLSLRSDPNDGRRRPLKLTASGQKQVAAIHDSANNRITEALSLLSNEERMKVVEGLTLYVSALNYARLRKDDNQKDED